MSSTGSIAEHPVVTGIRGAAEDLDPSWVGLVWQLSDDDVEAGLAGLFDVASRVTALQSALLREAETRDLKKRTKALTLVRWLSDRFRLSRADAGARVRAAEGIGRHTVVQAGLASGAVTADQAEVLVRVLDTVATMPGVGDADRAAAGRFLVDQCQTLAPRDLERAGKALVEALTVAPSEDDPADQAALERELARAEAEAQERERNFLTVTRRRGKLRAILEPGTIGEAILARFLHDKADKHHPGSDGFEDTRPLSERRGDAIVELLNQAAGTPTPRTTPTPTTDDQPDHDRVRRRRARRADRRDATRSMTSAPRLTTTTAAGQMVGRSSAGDGPGQPRSSGDRVVRVLRCASARPGQGGADRDHHPGRAAVRAGQGRPAGHRTRAVRGRAADAGL